MSNKGTSEGRGVSWRGLALAAGALWMLPVLGAGLPACDWDDDDDVDDIDDLDEIDDLDDVDYVFWDPYLYDYYWTADLAYSSWYWVDAWDYGLLYARTAQEGTGTVRGGLGAAIRALARGEMICPNQVTVSPKTGQRACATQDATSYRSGATIVFNGCQLPDGGRVDGTIDIQGTQTASDAACTPGATIITTSHTATISGLTYTSPSGARLVIPNQVDMGTTTYPLGSTPNTTNITSMGQTQTYAAGGGMISSRTFNGSRSFTYSPSTRSYAVDGTITSQDPQGDTTVLTGVGITRVPDCCRPVGGTLTVNRTGGTFPGMNTWTFGPTCGAATFNGQTASLPACL